MRTVNTIVFLLIMVCGIVAQQKQDSVFLEKTKSEQLKDSTDNQKIDFYFFEAERLKNRSELDEAIEKYNNCLKLDSTNAAALFELSKMYQLTNQFQKGYEYLKKAVKYAPKNDYYREIEGAYYIADRDYKSAIKIFEKLNKKNRNNQTYLYNLLALYKQTKQPKKFITTLNKIEQLNGISEDIVLEKIDFYTAQNQQKKAVEEIEKLMDKYPSQTKYGVLLGQYYMVVGDTTKAVSTFEQILKNHPNDGYALMNLYEYYNKKGDKQKAQECMHKAIYDNDINIGDKISILAQYIDDLEKDSQKRPEAEKFFGILLENYPKESKIYSLYSAYLLGIDDTIPATNVLLTAINLDPEEENNWQFLTQIYINQDSIDKVISIAEEAEKLFPNNSNWPYYKIMGLIQQNKKDSAMRFIDLCVDNKELESKSFKSLILNIKGDFLMTDSLYSQAFEVYEKSLEYNPNNNITLNNYAYFLSECGIDLTKAETMSGKSVQAEPQNPTYLDTYAWILFKKEDYRGAKIYIEKALIYSQEPTLLEHYGDILFKYGDTKKAVEQWKKAVEKGSDSRIIKQKIAERRYIPQELNCR